MEKAVQAKAKKVRQRRTWNDDQKREIIKEYENEGGTHVMKKYKVGAPSIARWRKSLGLKSPKRRRRVGRKGRASNGVKKSVATAKAASPLARIESRIMANKAKISQLQAENEKLYVEYARAKFSD